MSELFMKSLKDMAIVFKNIFECFLNKNLIYLLQNE